MKILDIPKQNRPRERFLKLGSQALSDAELFAILLRTGIRGKKNEEGKYIGGENVIEMSNRLIAEYGLDKLLDCSLKELQKIKGIGPAKAMQILTIAEIQKRINQSKKPITKINCAEDVFDLMHDKLKDEKQENFYVIMLDTKNNVIGEPALITKGILDASLVHPREVFKTAIKNSASKIILVHNHPSGDCEESPDDKIVRNLIRRSGEIINIEFIDSIIIGSDKYSSLIEKY